MPREALAIQREDAGLAVGNPWPRTVGIGHTGAMPMDPSPADLESLLHLAASHGLALDPASVRTEEVGLDFRVAFGRDAEGADWVLRIPRRPDVMGRAAVEGRLLNVLAPHLDVRVPDWRITAEDLIAYPLLPGEPGLTVSADGEVEWAIDMSSLPYADSLGTLVGRLHGMDPEEAARTGIEVRSPDEVRDGWRTDLGRVAEGFTIAPALRERWEAWIGEDSYWPDHSVLTHGELYPGHTLVVGEQISAVLDWTTAAVGDPARDLMFQRASAPAEAFEATLESYAAAGGRPWPRIGEHCAEMYSASPLAYGLFALETGQEEHRQAAAAALDPR